MCGKNWISGSEQLSPRFQTLYLQSQNLQQPINPTTGKSQPVSYGSCQFPTLGFVVERYKEREEFVSQPFWFLEMTHQKDGIEVEFKWERNRISDISQCLAVYMQVMSLPIEATVQAVDSKPKSKWRPLPLNTVAFEKLAASKLRISAKDAMKVAEKLYTSGVISYPRTETNIFPKSLNLSHHVEQQVESSAWGDFARDLMQRGVHPRQGKQTDNAHPPIYPTRFTSSLSGQEARVYELIARHFLACCSADAQGLETTTVAEVGGEKFKASGLIILARNYLDVYPYDKWSAKELPQFATGEKFVPDEILMREGCTSAPQLLTESDLISLMERHGIGTDATHADHIETIKVRQYVKLTADRRLKPLRLGLGLIEGYNKIKDEMSKPQLRAALERDLQAICDGVKSPSDVLQNQIEMYRNVFQLVSDRVDILGQEIRRSNLTYNDNDGNDGGDGPDDGAPGGGPAGGRRGTSVGRDGSGSRGRNLGSGSTHLPNTGAAGGQYSNSHPGRSNNNNTDIRPQVGQNSGAARLESGDPPSCGCNLPANRKTVKAGKNAGREFYGCANFSGAGTGCDFFQWREQTSEQSTATNGSTGDGQQASGRGRGLPSSRRTVATRKCGNCGEAGHTKSHCTAPSRPTRGNSRGAGRGAGRGTGRGSGRGAPAPQLPTDMSFDQVYTDFYS